MAKYSEWLMPDKLLLLAGWARNGLTEEQIAHNMGIKARTLYGWKNKYPEIAQALRDGKEVADIRVENALYKKALGFHETVRKPFKVKKRKFSDGGAVDEECIEYADDDIYIPPDTTAMIYWLKNRKRKDWCDRPSLEADGADDKVVIVDDI